MLIGSTERMGVGTNVQERAVALHHLDCPWRPADIRQREGRILRQGNRNPEVRILRYVTEASFDGFVWGTVERKAQFIGQVMRGRLDVREIEDVGDVTLSYQEVKALATGNPLLLEQAKAEAELVRLERLERAHARNLAHLRGSIRANERELDHLGKTLTAIDRAIVRRRESHCDGFAIVVQGMPTTKRPEAETRLRAALTALLVDSYQSGTPTIVAGLGGFDMSASVDRHGADPAMTLRLDEVPGSELRITAVELGKTAIVTRLENRLARLDNFRNETSAKVAGLQAENARAADLIAKPFAQVERLADARARVESIADQLTALSSQKIQQNTPHTEVATSEGVVDLRRQWARCARAAPSPLSADLAGHPPAGARMP